MFAMLVARLTCWLPYWLLGCKCGSGCWAFAGVVLVVAMLISWLNMLETMLYCNYLGITRLLLTHLLLGFDIGSGCEVVATVLDVIFGIAEHLNC